MSTIFIGGSRHVSRLPSLAKERLNNVIGSGFDVIVGDANGADKAVQRHLVDAAYEKVTVFCSGNRCRNNLGNWRTQNISSPTATKGFQFYAAKDREMARLADFGLMIWDGKSPGTVLNVLRLIQAGKKAVLLKAKEKEATTFKTVADWKAFLLHCDAGLESDLRKRATPDEWRVTELEAQPSFFDEDFSGSTAPVEDGRDMQADDEVLSKINTALAGGDPRTVVTTLGDLARACSMSQISNETGLARESLYRALSLDGNPEFATVLKVIKAVGLRLTIETTTKDSAE